MALIYDFCNKELENYKGDNYKDNDYKKYYDCGAHFSYKYICKILENVVMSLSAERRGISMYEDNNEDFNTDSKKNLKLNYEQVCRFVDNYNSVNIDHTDLLQENGLDCKQQILKPEIDIRSGSDDQAINNNLEALKIKSQTVEKSKNLEGKIFRKIDPNKATKVDIVSKQKSKFVNQSKPIITKRDTFTKTLRNIKSIKINKEVKGKFKMVLKTNEKHEIKSTSPSNYVLGTNKSKNPVTSFEYSNISQDKNKKLNFSHKKLKIDVTPQTLNINKLASSLIELNINNTVHTKSKSRNILKLLTTKTIENSKNVDKNLTNNNTKDTFLSSNKLFSSNLTAAYEKKPSKEINFIKIDKSPPINPEASLGKSCRKITFKYLNSTKTKKEVIINRNLKKTNISKDPIIKSLDIKYKNNTSNV